jgi:nicotinate (nicotinamide) nucleotide adenylyltransferase
MNNVAIFGSACDPITLHHLRLAELVTMKTGMPVWVMPCFHHRFGKDKRLVDPVHRWAMTCLAAINRACMIPCSFELTQRHCGSMYSTLKGLKLLGNNFHVVIGMDNANKVETEWDHGSDLIREYPFIIFGRQGEAPCATWFNKEPHITMHTDYHLSSTDVRDAIARGDYDFAKAHLCPEVWSYIQREGLYGYHD